MMDRPLRIFLGDLVHDYRPEYFCTPLGIGFIGSYLKHQFGREVDVRLFKSPGALIDAMREPTKPDLIGLSNYSWNCEINKLIIDRATAELPDTILLQGGPHIRVDRNGIEQHLRAKPNVDYYAMLEGEFPTAGLVEYILSSGLSKPEICPELPGIAFLRGSNLVYSERKIAKDELGGMPSPYLSGIMDEFLKSPAYLPLIETNRGCPFACTFCVWGISALDKVRKFDIERVLEEFKYISSMSKASLWYFTDANFGMFERDVEIARAIRAHAEKSPYLNRVVISWAKNSSKHCVEIQKILTGISDTLVAVQTTDPKVLKEIKRDNIKMTTMTDLLDAARKDGISMSTDILAGLPGESLESHFNTLRTVFALGFENFNIGQIRLLPGSEMESDNDRTKYQLKTKFRLISGFSGVYDNEPVAELEECVISTSTMTLEEIIYTLRIVHFLAWSMWNSGLAQSLLRYTFKTQGINPLDSLLQFLSTDLPDDVRALMEGYKAEARTEWFDTEEDAQAYFKENAQKILGHDNLKLNLKYLAKMLLDPDLARSMLGVLARNCDPGIRDELVSFCLDRAIFVKDRTRNKQVLYSTKLIEALASIYPLIQNTTANVCTFTLSEKFLRSIDFELERFKFDKDPLVGLTLTLSSYGAKFFYDFSFGGNAEPATKQTKAFDSFNYDKQWTPTNETPA